MGLAVAYHLDSQEPSLAYDHSCCFNREYGRVRSVSFIHKRYLNTLLSDPDNAAVWQTGISQGLIVILPEVSGSFESGEPTAYKGYGERLSTFGKRTMTLSFSDPRYAANYPFYNSIHQQTNLVIAFRTSSILHIANTPASIFAGDPIDEEVDSEVVWNVKAVMRSRALPVKVSMNSLLNLFYCNPIASGITNRILSVPDGHFITTVPENNRITFI